MDTPEKYMYRTFLIASIGLGTFITLFILALARHLRKNLALVRANILAEINASEKERNRIAADLHDELGPALCAIKMMVNGFEFIDPAPQLLQEQTDQQLGVLIQRIRGISHDLMPTELIEQGLHNALESAMNYFDTASEVRISTFFEGNITYSEDQTLHLYRIVNEIVHNTIKHAKATEMKISIRKSGQQINLMIRENGIGFDFNELAASSTGHGLRSLISRAKLLDGSLHVNRLSGGMDYRLTIPCQKE